MKQLFTILSLGCFCATASAATDRVLDFSRSVTGLDEVRVEVNVGSLEVVAWDRDFVEAEIELELDDDSWGRSKRERSEEAIDRAELKADVRGNRLHMEVDFKVENDIDVEEHWVVKMPAGMSLTSELNVGEASIEGVGGGVDAEVNVGELSIDVPAGEIHAEVNVGEINITSATDSVGDVSLDANVGDADLRVHGESVRDTSSTFSPGSEIRYRGSGKDDIVVDVNVGDVDVRIN